MFSKHVWPAAGLLAAAVLALGACGTAAAPELASPATIVPVKGSDIPRLELTPGAVQRLGIQTKPVTAAAPGTAGATEVIPYPAVVYDTDGSSWTYVAVAPDTYVRRPITVSVIRGDVALLSAGPPVGTRVVTVGTAELLGTEYNISGEE
ncbi:MAG: hypothetical protein J2P26_07725 [Nocardiopsaceae bacterium]|nr:hypothetical protein [Nocardiopsaceae bacterium]